MRIAILIFAATMMFPFSARACDENAYRQATLDILSDNGLYPTDESTCGWLTTCRDTDIAAAHQRAKDIRDFGSVHGQDTCAKERYDDWAHFVDAQADRGEQEMKGGERNKSYDSYLQRMKDQDKRAAEVKQKLLGKPQ